MSPFIAGDAVVQARMTDDVTALGWPAEGYRMRFGIVHVDFAT
jgi:hypothetical protein